MGKLVMKLAGLTTGLENDDVVLPEDLANVDPDSIEGALESDDLMAAEIDAVEDVSAIQQDLDTVDRLEAQATGLEDLATVLDHVNENNEGGVTESEAVLTEIASDMAVVGTDLKTDEDVVPGLESLIGQQVSTESLKETAKKYWKKIVEMLKAIWDRIKAFFGNVEARIKTYRREIAKISRDLTNRTNEIVTPKISVSTKFYTFNGKVPKTLEEAVVMAEEAGNSVNPIFEYLVGGLSTLAAKVEVGPVKPNSLKEVNDKVEDMLKNVASRLKGEAHLGGNLTFTHNFDEVLRNQPTNDEVARAAQLRGAAVSFESKASDKDNVKEYTINTGSRGEAKKVVSFVSKVLQAVQKEHEKQTKYFSSISTKDIPIKVDASADGKVKQAEVNAVLAYSTMISRLQAKVVPKLLQNMLAGVAAGVSMSRKVANAYATK